MNMKKEEKDEKEENGRQSENEKKEEARSSYAFSTDCTKALET